MDSLYFRKEISENKKYLKLITIFMMVILILNTVSVCLIVDIKKTQESILKTQNDIVKLQKEIEQAIEAEIEIENERASSEKVKEEAKEEPKKVDEEIDILKKAGEAYNIDPKLLEAIERLETGHYTSDVYKSMNNSWGAMDGDNFICFDSPDESTMALAKCLRTYYFDEGYDTIEKISKKYCPVNAEHWAEQVSAIYSEL